MKKKQQPKVVKPLPSWIIVSANDPKLKEAMERKIAEELAKRESK